jgi:hypothetical protein
MATTTTNFSFPIPQSTDLVKDGATAIAALGTSVDTQFVDLKGGTTGQVLAKASNTDLDYPWVTTDDANAIQNAIVDAKGDLISATGNDTPARLAVGNNGETLVADSSTSTGLRYQGLMAAAKNFVNNGGFDIWQRGTSIAAIANDQAYSADRWKELNNAGLSTYSRQATGDTTNLPFIQYCMRVQRNSGQTATGVIYFTQSMESVNSIPLAGRTITFSFYARAGANYSATSNILSAQVSSGTGTNENINQGFTGLASIISQNATLTTTWQRFSYTGTVSSTATQLGYYFNYSPTGTASTNDYFEVTGVQLELGSVATTFMRQGGTIQGELAACQRYYFRATAETSAFAHFALGFASATTSAQQDLRLPVTMRTEPSSVDFSTLRLEDINSAQNVTTCTLSTNSSTTNTATFDVGVASGLTQYRSYFLGANNSTSAYIGVSAEL